MAEKQAVVAQANGKIIYHNIINIGFTEKTGVPDLTDYKKHTEK